MSAKHTKEVRNKRGVYFHSQSPNVWDVGIYIRLSVADGNDVSLSVTNQDKIINHYLQHEFGEAYRVHKVYIDDGVSGTTEDKRLAFQEMIEAIRQGMINCVVAKSLSRTFRNYSDQGYYLEEFFPGMGIRFITLESPKVDTFSNPDILKGYELPLNGIVNDRYAEMTSVSVRQTFTNMRRAGKFQGGFPPYGYIRDPEDKYHFIIDEEAADIVRQIFHWYVFGDMGMEAIRRRLNEMCILNPSAYKISTGAKYRNPNMNGAFSSSWSQTTIKQILMNQTYIGAMVQGKYTMISYKVHKQIQVPKEQWVIVPDMHEAIIEKSIFDKAQELMRRNKNNRRWNSKPSLLSGFVYCADCQRKMNKRKNGNRIYYACSTYYKRNKNDCTSHFTRAPIIENAVLEAIQRQVALLDLDVILDEIDQGVGAKQHNSKMGLLQSQLSEQEKLDQKLESLYLDYSERIITKAEYLTFKNKFLERKAAVEKNIEDLQVEIGDEQKRKAECGIWEETLRKYKNITGLNRKILEELVEKIYVDQEKNVTILFKYRDLFDVNA